MRRCSGLPRDPAPSTLDALAEALSDPRVGGTYRRSSLEIDRFEVRRLIGRGATSLVVAAHDPVADREVALELLRPEVDTTTDVRRLRAALPGVAHANVVRVREVGVFDGHVYIAMDLLRGRTLAAWLTERPSWYRVLRVLEHAALGLFAIHRTGHVHADVSPATVMIEPGGRYGADGRVRLIGLGSVRPARTPAPARSPAFAALETLRGLPIDARADQFSFCATFFAAIFATPAFAGDTPHDLAVAIDTSRIAHPRTPPDVPPRMLDVLSRGLRAEPDARWRDMMELLQSVDDDPPKLVEASPGYERASLGVVLLGLTALIRACNS